MAHQKGINNFKFTCERPQYFPGREFSHLSQFCKGGQDKKKYPASKNLLLIGLFPFLSQSPARPLGVWVWVFVWVCVSTPSAPGRFLGTASKALAAFARGQLF